jgi:hypothetical protein
MERTEYPAWPSTKCAARSGRWEEGRGVMRQTALQCLVYVQVRVEPSTAVRMSISKRGEVLGVRHD